MSEENESDIILIYDNLLYFFSNKVFGFFNKLSLICEQYQKIEIYKKIRIIILLINTILLSLYSDINSSKPFYYTIEIIFLIFYFIDFLIKQISFGLYRNKKGYLKNKWNIFEFSQLLIGIISSFPKMRKNKYICWYRGLRPFSLIKEIYELKIIFDAILTSLKEMINVFILLLFIFLVYAVLAVNIWSGIFYRRCRINPIPINGTFEIIDYSNTLCGGLNQCENCYSIFDFYQNGTYLFKNDINLELRIDELNHGYSTFDNFFKAFLTIYNCMTLNGWSKIMYLVQNGYSYTGSSIFFISLVIILNYLVLNFTIAILMDNIEKNSQKNDDKYYFKLIDFEEEANKILYKKKFISSNRFKILWNYFSSFHFFKKVIPKYIHHSKYKITFYCYYISQQPIWGHLTYIITFTKVILLLQVKKIYSNKFNLIIDYIIVILFDIDCILKIIGNGFKNYFTQTLNLFDLIIAISVSIEFVLSKKSVLSVLFLLRTLNIIKDFKVLRNFNIMIFLVGKTIQNILLFFILIFILVYVFSLIGITLFKGVFDDIKLKNFPKRNFDGFMNALKTVFSLLIGDDWYVDMIIYLNLNKVNNFTVYSYFLFTNIFLNSLLMNLVIAFLVYHYDNSRKKQRFRELTEIIRLAEKSIGLKRTNSFSFTYKTIKVREIMDFKPKININNKNNDKLNKTDLFDYLIENEKFGEKNEVYKFTHDINTDKITSKDNFGFGIIMKKIKKEKAIQIFNEQIQKKNKKRKSIQNNREIISLLNKNAKNEINESSKRIIPRRRSSTKNLITSNFLNKKKFQNEIQEYKIEMEGPENESKPLDEMYLNQDMDKKVLLNMVNKEYKNSFVCPTKTLDIKNSTLIIKKEDNQELKRRTSIVNKVYNIFNQFYKDNHKLKIPENQMRNRFSARFNRLNIKESMVEKKKNSQSVIHNSNFINLQKIKNRRIIFINNNIFCSMKIKKFSVIDIDKFKKSKFFDYISQSSLFIFHRKSKIRKFCLNISNKNSFKFFFVLLTIISSFFLMFNTPYLDPNSKTKIFFYYSEGIFLIFFWIETIIKIIANGLIFKDNINQNKNTTLYERLLEISDTSNSNSSSQFILIEKSNQLLNKLSKISVLKNNIINNNEVNKKEINENENNNEDQQSVISSKSKISKSSFNSSSQKIISSQSSNQKNINSQSLNNQSINSQSSSKKSSSLLNQKNENNITNQNINNSSQSNCNQTTSKNQIINTKKKLSYSLKNTSSFSKINVDNNITEPYLRSIINSLDLLILIFNFHIFINLKSPKMEMKDFKNCFKILYYFLCFRPFRMISNFNRLRQVFIVLILSFPSILYVLLITLIVFFMYAIVGLNYFKGLLGNCSNENYKTQKLCEKNNFEWISQDENFDTLSSSILTIYELATTSGWFDIMNQIDIATNNLSVLYFVSFMIIGSIFMMNFSVTCVIDTFVALREKMEGDAFLTENQKEWVKAVKMFMKFKPVPTLNIHSNKIKKIRKISYIIVTNKFFNGLVNILIFFNIMIMCFSHLGQDKYFTDFQSYFFYFSSIIFIFEMIMKIIAYKSLFFIDSMNIFDLFIVICSNLSIIFSILQSLNNGKSHFRNYDAIPGLIKGIRVLRVFRLINLNFAIKNYLKIILFITPQLLNILSILLMFLVIFIILGMNLFSTIKYGEVINDNVNFKDAFSSLNTLIRVLTGDQWNEIMHELALNQENCIKEVQSYEELMKYGPLGCGTWSSYPYFTFFMILNSTIIVNMFIAVIVGTFMEENVDSNGKEISTREIKEFYNLWSKYDPKVKYSININRFILFMTELKYPMGLNGDKFFDIDINKLTLKGKIFFSPDRRTVLDEDQVKIISEKLGIQSRNGKIHILDVIKLINKRYIIAQKEGEEDLQTLEKYQKELKLFDIKQRKVGRKLKKEFNRYHKDYRTPIEIKRKGNINNYLSSSPIILKK